MTVLDHLRVLRRGWLRLLVGALVGLALMIAFCAVQTPQYESTSQVFVSTPSGSAADLNQGGSFAQQVVKSYASVATQPLVLDAVIKGLGLSTTSDELEKHVTVTTPADQVLISISVQDPSPTRAAAIANAITAQLSTVVVQLTPDTAQTASVVKLTQTQVAVASDVPVFPRWVVLVPLGLVGGLVLGAFWVLAADALNTRLRDAADLRPLTDRPVLGEVPRSSAVAKAPAAVSLTLDPRLAEALRFVRANLRFLELDGSRNSFVITSAVPGEGKTTVAAGLALVLAESGRNVLVVDADLRRPRLMAAYGLSGETGLSEVLVGDATPDRALHRVGQLPLWVMPSGATPPNPNDLLQSDRMRAFVEEATSEFDHVIFDAPPSLAVADAAVLAGLTGGAVFVSGVDAVRTTQIAAALDVLSRAHVKVLGHIVTMTKAGSSTYSYEYKK